MYVSRDLFMLDFEVFGFTHQMVVLHLSVVVDVRYVLQFFLLLDKVGIELSEFSIQLVLLLELDGLIYVQILLFSSKLINLVL